MCNTRKMLLIQCQTTQLDIKNVYRWWKYLLMNKKMQKGKTASCTWCDVKMQCLESSDFHMEGSVITVSNETVTPQEDSDIFGTLAPHQMASNCSWWVPWSVLFSWNFPLKLSLSYWCVSPFLPLLSLLQLRCELLS
jgi:hypothetical protein